MAARLITSLRGGPLPDLFNRSSADPLHIDADPVIGGDCYGDEGSAMRNGEVQV
jgi:hypothetical protein